MEKLDQDKPQLTEFERFLNGFDDDFLAVGIKRQILKKHNAALAAEREKVKELADELEQERNLHLQAANAMHLEHLRQLAAEREKAEKVYTDCAERIVELEAANQTLVDLLKRIAYADPAWRKEIDAALAKIGGK